MKSGIEIEISTFNRKDILQDWLERNYDALVRLEIALAIYDSSTNSETSDLIANFNKKAKQKIKYVHMESEVRIDEKVLFSMLYSEFSYVWPMGDSRTIDFNSIEKKILPRIRESCDFVCLWSETFLDNDGKEYINAVDFFNDCFWHATWLGGLIIKKKLLHSLENKHFLDKCLKKYYRNDGFSYLGIFFDLIADKNISAFFFVIKIEEISSIKKPGWLKRYLEVWCDNLCYLIDNLDNTYMPVKSKVIKELWKTLKLDGPYWCYKARIANGLNKNTYRYYNDMGYLDRVSEHKSRIKYFATLRRPFLDIYYYIIKLYLKINKGVML